MSTRLECSRSYLVKYQDQEKAIYIPSSQKQRKALEMFLISRNILLLSRFRRNQVFQFSQFIIAYWIT